MTTTTFHAYPCAICGNSNLRRIAKRGQFGFACYVSICPYDGLVFLSPRWSKKRYDRFYNCEYDQYYRPKALHNEDEHSAYRSMKEICSRLETHHALRDKVSVLDVGAGMGWGLEYLKQTYPALKHFTAIEASAHCRKHIHENISARVVANDVDEMWENPGTGLVIMRHVLEHLLNPVNALITIQHNLATEGVVYISVPNMMQPQTSLTHHWFRPVHTFYFSPATLCSVAQLAGLVPIIIKAEGGELWGCFRKQSYSDIYVVYPNVYNEQVRIIKHKKRVDLVKSVKATVPDAIKHRRRAIRG